jgi:outer membrane protein
MPNKIAHKEASMSAERSSSPSSRRSPPLSRLSRLGLALSLMLGAVGVAQAQSLQELYEAARGYDASYLAARSLAESVQYRVEQSRALLRPSASLSGGVSRINSEGTAPTSNTNGSQIGVTAAYPLFNRANSVTVEQAVKQLDLAKAQLDSAEPGPDRAHQPGLLRRAGGAGHADTTRTKKAAVAEQLASAKRNFEVGTSTITDTREAQARYDLVIAQEIAAENDLRVKRIALDTLVGRTNVSPSRCWCR